jgi:hypothetical protein
LVGADIVKEAPIPGSKDKLATIETFPPISMPIIILRLSNNLKETRKVALYHFLNDF